MLRFSWVSIFLLFGIVVLTGQTCCSSGVPIASNVGFSSGKSHELKIALGYEINSLNNLFNESSILIQNNRRRRTQSILLRAGYNLNEKISVESLLPYVNQVRTILTNNGSEDQQSTSGIGDFLFLIKYQLLNDETFGVNIGGGIKLPTGSTSATNTQGLLIVNDLQSGSGAMDFVLRANITASPKHIPDLTLFSSFLYFAKGVDNSFLGSQTYQYGNEWQVFLGANYQTFWLNRFFYPSFSFRVRNALRDRINQNQLENTGGSWVFGRATIGVELTTSSRISTTYEFPLYTNVDGTQLSPTHIINISFYKTIDFNNDDFTQNGF